MKKHGVTNPKKKMLHQIIGVNSRLDTIQAAVLNAKLKILPNELKKRKKVFFHLKSKIENKDIFIPESYNAITPTIFTAICKIVTALVNYFIWNFYTKAKQN